MVNWVRVSPMWKNSSVSYGWVLVDLLSSVLLLSLWAEPGVKALWSRHAHVECHHVSTTELAEAGPKAPALLSASPGGATASSPGCRV